MKHYAQINDDNICIGISRNTSKILNNRMIEIPMYDCSYLGKRYLEDGTWEWVKSAPIPSQAPTQLDRIEELQLISAVTNEYVACLLELGI